MGLLDAINGGLQQGMQSPLFNLGAGLIAGAQPFQNPGQQLMGAAGVTQAEQARQQQLYMQAMQMRMLQQQWPYMQQLFTRLGGLMGAPSKSKGSESSLGRGRVQPAGSVSDATGPAGVGSPAPVVGPFSAIPSAAPAPMATAPAPNSPVSGTAPSASGLPDPMALQRFGLMASMFPMTAPMGKAAQAAASFEAQYSPQLQAQLAYAKSAVGQAQAALQQAKASGNPDAIRGAEVQLLTAQHRLQMASFSGNVSAVGVSPQQLSSLGISTFNPSQGIQTTNGQASPIPGMIAARQALAGAQARGEAQGQVQKVWNPQTQQWNYVPRSALLGGPTVPTAPTSTPGAPSFAAAPNPQLDAYLRGTGTEGARQVVTLSNAADAAQKSNFALAQILADSQGVVTGPTAGARKWVDTATAAITQWFGVAPPASLANYQEIDKYSNQVAFAASRQLGSREAGQIVELERQSNANKGNVPAALRDLVGAAHAANSYVIAQNQYVQTVAQRNGGNALYAQANFTSNADPRVWELAISPELAAKWAPRIGLPKIAKVMPYMLPQTAYDSFRNLPRATQEALTKRLDPAFMQAMINAAR